MNEPNPPFFSASARVGALSLSAARRNRFGVRDITSATSDSLPAPSFSFFFEDSSSRSKILVGGSPAFFLSLLKTVQVSFLICPGISLIRQSVGTECPSPPLGFKPIRGFRFTLPLRPIMMQGFLAPSRAPISYVSVSKICQIPPGPPPDGDYSFLFFEETASFRNRQTCRFSDAGTNFFPVGASSLFYIVPPLVQFLSLLTLFFLSGR